MPIHIASFAENNAEILVGRLRAQGFELAAQWELDGEFRIILQQLDTNAPFMELKDFGNIVENAAIGLPFRPKTIARHAEWRLHKVAYQYLPYSVFERTT